MFASVPFVFLSLFPSPFFLSQHRPHLLCYMMSLLSPVLSVSWVRVLIDGFLALLQLNVCKCLRDSIVGFLSFEKRAWVWYVFMSALRRNSGRQIGERGGCCAMQGFMSYLAVCSSASLLIAWMQGGWEMVCAGSRSSRIGKELAFRSYLLHMSAAWRTQLQLLFSSPKRRKNRGDVASIAGSSNWGVLLGAQLGVDSHGDISWFGEVPGWWTADQYMLQIDCYRRDSITVEGKLDSK